MKKAIKTVLSFILCLAMLTATAYAPEPVAADDGVVTVAVNFVYESNNSMVAQPYYASILAGSEFKKSIAAPKIINYSVPVDKATGLNNTTIVYSEDADGNGTVTFDIESVDDDIEVALYYVAGTAEYTVNHYLQNLENDEYTLDRTVQISGSIDAYTKAVADIHDGFVCTGVPEYIIAEDDTTVVDIYYDRAYYTVIFDVNGGVNGPAPIYAKYGTQFDVSEINTPQRAGYNFSGWSPELSGEVTGNVTYKAKWTPKSGKADYTIVIWGQNPNDNEYSYMSSHEAWGDVGSTVTWTPGLLICQEHMSAHTHTLSCYGVTQTKTPSNTELNYFRRLTGGIESGYVYRYECNSMLYPKDEYYLYFNGTWYKAASANANVGKTVDGTNVDHDWHSDSYYKYEAKTTCQYSHSHTDNCYMKSFHPGTALWDYEKSDTVVIDAAGSTVLNVYFTRKQFTLTFKYNYRKGNYQSTQTITDRWGADISTRYKAIAAKAGSTFWSKKTNGDQPYTNYIGIMPKASATYYLREEGSSTGKMTYYAEDLNGNYKEMFSVSGVRGYTVTVEDRYEFEGFTYDHGSELGSGCDGAKFYYKRNSYTIDFYSASNSTADRSSSVKYEAPLSAYEYVPTSKPNTVEAEAVFAGWYLNPEFTGEKFDFSSHKMPSHNLALYAKWVNGYFTVETYTDESLSTLYTYDGYNGVQTEIEKYTLANAPVDPEKEGEAFVGWFYKDANGNEQPFSFTMPITRDYKLYPKFSDKVMVTYTVHYYLEGTTTKLADDKVASVLMGTTVTEKAKMHRSELNLVANPDNYFPHIVSTSAVIDKQNIEIIFYYKQGIEVNYTVKYVDANGNDLIKSVEKTTDYSIVTETYVKIDGYTPRQYKIEKELSFDGTQNIITFVYDPIYTELTIRKTGAEDIDENQTFMFVVKGVDENNSNIELTVTIHGNSEVTVTGLPLGNYSITEKSNWSWRYQPEQETQLKTLTANVADNTVTFNNTRVKDKWLDGDNYKVNAFNGK